MKKGKAIKLTYVLTFITCIALFSAGCFNAHTQQETIYQISTYDFLLESVFEGNLTYKELKEHGDFGIGTFHALDGEMIALEGSFYQIKADGIAYPVDDGMTTPFAVVTFFETNKMFVIDNPLDFKHISEYIDTQIPTKNIFYALWIDGDFSYIKVRSVPQQQKPYPPISEVIKNQTIFEYNNVKGTMVGFRFPAYMKELNVPGYHFHFITEDRKKGGHMLDCILESGKGKADITDKLFMLLPDNEEFYKADLTKD